ARWVEPDAGLVAMGFDDQLEGVTQILSAFVQRPSLADGPRDFFNPSHEPPVRLRLNDGVVSLFHAEHFAPAVGGESRQECCRVIRNADCGQSVTCGPW